MYGVNQYHTKWVSVVYTIPDDILLIDGTVEKINRREALLRVRALGQVKVRRIICTADSASIRKLMLR